MLFIREYYGHYWTILTKTVSLWHDKYADRLIGLYTRTDLLDHVINKQKPKPGNDIYHYNTLMTLSCVHVCMYGRGWEVLEIQTCPFKEKDVHILCVCCLWDPVGRAAE